MEQKKSIAGIYSENKPLQQNLVEVTIDNFIYQFDYRNGLLWNETLEYFSRPQSLTYSEWEQLRPQIAQHYKLLQMSTTSKVHIHGIEIYSEHIRKYEPFIFSLEIYGVEAKSDGTCIRFSVNELRNIDFYSVYGYSSKEKCQYCLADCESLELAEQFAQALQVFSGFNLQVDIIKNLENEQE